MTPKIRQTVYRLGVIVSSVLGIALIWGGVSQGMADHLNTVMAGLLALLGGGGPAAVAARTVGRQAKDGTFDTLPVAEQAITAIQATIQQATAAQADVTRVTQAVTDALQSVPVVGPAASQAAGSLIDQVMQAAR